MPSLASALASFNLDRLIDLDIPPADAKIMSKILATHFDLSKLPLIIEPSRVDEYSLLQHILSLLEFRIVPVSWFPTQIPHFVKSDLLHRKHVVKVEFSTVLGKGAYGKVQLADIFYKNSPKSKQTQQLQCASKQFQHCEDNGLRYFLREVAFLDRLQQVPNVPRIYLTTFNKIFMTQGKWSLDLVPNITPSEIRLWVHQLAVTLCKSHALRVAHCDLKPQNIVITENRQQLLLVDWASAIMFKHEHCDTLYVTTRYYRPPECVLTETVDFLSWSCVDVWSFGCIVAELLLESILFPLQNSRDAAHCANVYSAGIVRVQNIPFLRRILQLNPKDRPTMKQILSWNIYPAMKI